jgi:hypothetical protein
LFIVIDSYDSIYNSILNELNELIQNVIIKIKNNKSLSLLNVFPEEKGWQNITGEISFLVNILCCVTNVHNKRVDVNHYLFAIFVCFSYYI